MVQNKTTNKKVNPKPSKATGPKNNNLLVIILILVTALAIYFFVDRNSFTSEADASKSNFKYQEKAQDIDKIPDTELIKKPSLDLYVFIDSTHSTLNNNDTVSLIKNLNQYFGEKMFSANFDLFGKGTQEAIEQINFSKYNFAILESENFLKFVQMYPEFSPVFGINNCNMGYDVYSKKTDIQLSSEALEKLKIGDLSQHSETKPISLKYIISKYHPKELEQSTMFQSLEVALEYLANDKIDILILPRMYRDHIAQNNLIHLEGSELMLPCLILVQNKNASRDLKTKLLEKLAAIKSQSFYNNFKQLFPFEIGEFNKSIQSDLEDVNKKIETIKKEKFKIKEIIFNTK